MNPVVKCYESSQFSVQLIPTGLVTDLGVNDHETEWVLTVGHFRKYNLIDEKEELGRVKL